MYVDLDVGYLLFISIAIEIHFDFILFFILILTHSFFIVCAFSSTCMLKMVSFVSNFEANVALSVCVCDLFFLS